MTPPPSPAPDAPISAARKWAITFSVMMVTVMQVLDTSITNVALPHMQGSLSAGTEEMSWVITSFLAANAIAIPATGWLTAMLGRRRFFMICTTIFTISSFLSGIAQNPDVPPEVTSQANVELANGIPFISDADLETALEEAGASPAVTQAVVDENEQARLDGLRSALALLALIAVVALFFTRRIPDRQPGAAVAGGSP